MMMPFELHQDRERVNADGRPRGQDCGRVDVAFVENAEDQIHHDEGCKDLERGIDVVHIARQVDRGCRMDELNGRMMACQILITGLIARVANDSPDPLRFLSDFRDEIKAVVRGVNITGMDNTDRVRQVAQSTVDELFSLMKPPSTD
jgi:hypothetical protein